MRRQEYRKGLAVKLERELRLRCCECQPIPQGATVVLFDQVSPNRAWVGLYFDPDAPSGAIHHKIWPLEKPEPIPGGMKKGTGRARDIFLQGGFCMHKVKISGIQGAVVGEVNKEIFERRAESA